MKKNVLIAGGIALALVVGAVILRPASPPAPVSSEVPKPSGSLTSPEIISDHISIDGVTTWTLVQSFKSASTTLCSFPNPAGSATSTYLNSGVPAGLATSSIVSLSVNITTGTGTAAFFDIGTSTTPFATSSPMMAYGVSVPASSLLALEFRGWTPGLGTSTDARLWASGAPALLGAGESLNVKTSTGGLGGYTYGGQCVAVIKSFQAR